MTNTLTFLGTSTSVGIPVIGCDCPRCTSDNPKDHRMRSSVLIETPNQTLLVDAGPDLRQQALRQKLKHVDNVLYTHAHLDHIAGFDELRAFCWRRKDRLPLYGNVGCLEEIKRMYSWAFCESNTYQGYIRPRAIELTSEHQIADLKVTPIPVLHGAVETSGFRFETEQGHSLVYIPDVIEIPDSSFELIGQPDVFIIDCLREEEHVSHMNLTKSLKAIARVKPNQAYLTHCSHEMDTEIVGQSLPSNVQFAYDTLTINF